VTPTRRRPALPVTLRDDARAGLVLGIHSVPDGLANGLLSGLNPLTGLHAYIVGTMAGTLAVSSTFMVVQGTGAMALIVAEVDVLQGSANQASLLATLAILTGALMILAGVLRLGRVLRFVSNAVMVGFMSAVGVNIILGQLPNLTGFAATGANRLTRTASTFASPGELSWPSIAAGASTIGLILLLERTRVGALGLVIAVIAVSAGVAVLGNGRIATLGDQGFDAMTLPSMTLPSIGEATALILPAFALAFVALVQGAGVAAAFPNADGRRGDPSRDFTGQGIANVAAGLGGGLPVGGSASASSLNRTAGARTRLAPAIAAVVMVVVIVVFGEAVASIALPSLAGLLILVGARTVNRGRIREVWAAGPVQRAVLLVTFGLTMIVPLQQAVMAGVALSFVLYVTTMSNRLRIRQRTTDESGALIEVDPAPEVTQGQIVVLQVYGTLFFASAAVLEASLPTVTQQTRHSVVILRLRGHGRAGSSVMQVLRRYGSALADADSRLMIVAEDPGMLAQLARLGVTDVIGTEGVYAGDHRVGQALAAATADARAWVAAQADGPPAAT
jgi:sulfate permease, SulP family